MTPAQAQVPVQAPGQAEFYCELISALKKSGRRREKDSDSDSDSTDGEEKGLFTGGSCGRRKGQLALQYLREKKEKKAGRRYAGATRTIERAGFTSMEVFVTEATQCNRDKWHLFPAIMLARIFEALKPESPTLEDWRKVRDLTTDALVYFDQLALSRNVQIAWHAALQEEVVALRSSTRGKVPWLLAYPKDGKLESFDDSFGVLVENQVRFAVTSARKEWASFKEANPTWKSQG